MNDKSKASNTSKKSRRWLWWGLLGVAAVGLVVAVYRPRPLRV
jgi:hypothetical protein